MPNGAPPFGGITRVEGTQTNRIPKELPRPKL
jgi:hypothetical protein